MVGFNDFRHSGWLAANRWIGLTMDNRRNSRNLVTNSGDLILYFMMKPFSIKRNIFALWEDHAYE